ncbi:hypothetical protein AVEN_261764-1 [Araneus ventricosus]|uniref:Uncharacterized protein n=1 Tax=Araneus ventricosus TaxID=182803 RepID=A0A4Y2GXU1_ARAVE|nr:hypothetical protein AVEN_261764-1 [Araneus ventricosus]
MHVIFTKLYARITHRITSKSLMKVVNHYQLSVERSERKSFSSSSLTGLSRHDHNFTVKCESRRLYFPCFVQSIPRRVSELLRVKGDLHDIKRYPMTFGSLV